MRKLSSLISGAALILTTGALGCVDIDPGDPFESLTTLSNDSTSGDGDGDGDMTGDGDPTGDGDGDPTAGDCGAFGEACCAGDVCDEGLSCGGDGTCGIGGGDGDGDPTGGDGDGWDPTMCDAPSMPIGVQGLEGNFCSAPCTTHVDCPAGPAGTMPGCYLISDPNSQTPDFCALVCSVAMDTCPAGSSCKDLMDAMNPGAGMCTFP